MKIYALLLLLCCVGTKAYCTDGNALLNICQSVEKAELSDTDAFNLQFCYGYIQGVIDSDGTWQGIMSYDKNHSHDKLRYCLPEDGFLFTQVARVVVKYMKDHPEDLHWAASVLVHNAFVMGFPCRVSSR
jgi:Rap1a immunity proteins